MPLPDASAPEAPAAPARTDEAPALCAFDAEPRASGNVCQHVMIHQTYVSGLALTLAVLDTVRNDLLANCASTSLVGAVAKTVSEVGVTAEARRVGGLATECLRFADHGIDTVALQHSQ